MAPEHEKTSIPGIYRRHVKGCARGGRCECSYVHIWRHRGRQHKASFRTLAEAREAKGNRDAGDRRPVARVGFEDYFKTWIESYAGRTARGFSETTRPEYRRPIKQHAIPKWGTWKLADVEPGDVRDLFGAMRKDGKSTSAIKKLRAALSAMFATAVEDEALKRNPVQGVRIPAPASDDAEDDEQAKALTRAELSALLAALPKSWRLFFEFLTHTGLRISEAIGLTWEHLDLGENPKVKVREQVYRGKRRRLKSGNGRRDIPLSPQMATRLLAHRRDTYLGQSRPVFLSSVDTELIPGKVASRILKPAGVRAGLLRPEDDWRESDKPESWLSFHVFRHTCASLLFAEGRNVKQVQEWLGHADPGFTLRTYIHLMDAGVGDATFFDRAVTSRRRRGNTTATQRPRTPASDTAGGSVTTAA